MVALDAVIEEQMPVTVDVMGTPLQDLRQMNIQQNLKRLLLKVHAQR